MLELYQCGIGLAPFPGSQASEPIRPDRDTHQPQGRKTGGCGHAPHLAVAALGDDELDPGGRDIFAETDWRVARPECRFGQCACTGRTCALAVQHDSGAQCPKRRFVRHAFHLHPVGLGQLVLGVGDPCLQSAIVGEQQQPFAVVVEAARRPHFRQRNKISQRSAACLVGELR